MGVRDGGIYGMGGNIGYYEALATRAFIEILLCALLNLS